MNWVSWAILGYMGLGALTGFRRGLILTVFSAAGYLAGLLVASRYQHAAVKAVLTVLPIAHWINRYIPLAASNAGGAHQIANRWIDGVVTILVFLLIVGLTESVGRTLGSAFTMAVRRFGVTGFVNGIGGSAAGVVEHGLVVSIILGLLVTFPVLAHTPLVASIQRQPLSAAMVHWFHRITRTALGKWL